MPKDKYSLILANNNSTIIAQLESKLDFSTKNGIKHE